MKKRKLSKSSDNSKDKDWHNNARDDIKQTINEQDRRNFANKLGPNWANILSGLGDQ